MSIDIFAADEQSDERIDLDRWVTLATRALEDEGVRGAIEVALIFADESTMSELNERFMGKVGPTDVLSFPIDDEPIFSGRVPDASASGPVERSDPEMPQMVGDIVICPVVAAKNAVEHECSFDDEVALLIVHGVLHLLGWDHEVDADAERMEARERELLTRHYQTSSS